MARYGAAVRGRLTAVAGFAAPGASGVFWRVAVVRSSVLLSQVPQELWIVIWRDDLPACPDADPIRAQRTPQQGRDGDETYGGEQVEH
jgi:hypothetical protein